MRIKNTALDENWWKSWSFIYRRFLSKDVEYFDICKGDKILDLGCGIGIHLKKFKQQGYTNVIGCDVNKNLLEECRKKGFKVVYGDMRRLNFKSNSFDVVYSYGIFHHIKEFGLALKEVNRVLKAGGYFCFIDIKPSIYRRILDVITFKLPISHPLKVRKNMLLEEKEMYDYFLMNHGLFMKLFMKNFKIVWHKKGLCMDVIKALPQKSDRRNKDGEKEGILEKSNF